LTLNFSGKDRIAVEPAITSAVRKASLASGSSFELLMASAEMESGFQTSAKASTSSAAGLFQFTEQTWLDTVRRHGAEHGMAAEASAIVDQSGKLTTADPAIRRRILSLRNDLSVATTFAADHLRDLSSNLSAGLGRAVTAGEVYLGHFLGAHGAKQMISAPQNQPAADILPEAAKSNSTLFYAPNGTPYTAAQFLQNVQKRVSQAFADIGFSPAGSSSAANGTMIANASGSAATGLSAHGKSAIQTIQSASERLAMASLMEPLLQFDRAGIAPKSHRPKLDSTMSTAALTALQTTNT
jgi:hypothetical protein